MEDQEKKQTYVIVLTDHEKIANNLRLYYGNSKYDHENETKIMCITNDYQRSINFLNQITDDIMADHKEKLQSVIIDKNTIHIFDRSTGWIYKNNQLLYTIQVIPYTTQTIEYKF